MFFLEILTHHVSANWETGARYTVPKIFPIPLTTHPTHVCISAFSSFKAVSWPTKSDAVRHQGLPAPRDEPGDQLYNVFPIFQPYAAGESPPLLRVLVLISLRKGRSIYDAFANEQQHHCREELGQREWEFWVPSNGHLGGFPTFYTSPAGK